MPQAFAQLMQSPQVITPTPFTPEMEQQYHAWRSQRIADEMRRWNSLIRPEQQGGLQTDRSVNEGMKQKLNQMLTYYSKDTPQLRAAYQQQLSQ